MRPRCLFLPTRTVQPWEVLLERRDGEATVVLGPGRHVVRRRVEHQVVDLRERIDLVPAQEVLTADGIMAKVSAVFRWVVADPVHFTERVCDPLGAVYLARLAHRAGAARPVDLAVRVRRYRTVRVRITSIRPATVR